MLEGGCGAGDKVHTLNYLGYDAYGVDFAAQTVHNIQRVAPELKVTVGDVRHLPYADGFFDGCWSLGVIEHFFDGYTPVIGEMARVIRKDGILLMTVPSMSPLRKLKARLQLYAKLQDTSEIRDSFYQFIVDADTLVKDMKKTGFDIISITPFDGIKGLKDEVSLFRPWLQRQYRASSPAAGFAKGILDLLSKSLTCHCYLYVFRRR